jgi:hypothetical protein
VAGRAGRGASRSPPRVAVLASQGATTTTTGECRWAVLEQAAARGLLPAGAAAIRIHGRRLHRPTSRRQVFPDQAREWFLLCLIASCILCSGFMQLFRRVLRNGVPA